MSETMIRVEGLGKRYHLGGVQRSYKTIRESILELARPPFKRQDHSGKNGKVDGPETFWALRDISFEIQKGEIIGIIGRNGAGKSTLLKVLSRITEPTTGSIDLYGRVGSLLEVGTGFHPELTGRENIFLNGAILGMRRAEIERKFDQIVEFAEVERFLDTPVKRYSSGMYTRLAFSVAAHLETEILVVDEVLAVGDAQFQKKCLDRMQEVSRGGRTILFVSHNMAAVRNICTRGIILRRGRLVEQGEINTLVDHYLAAAVQERSLNSDVQTKSFRLTDVEVTSAAGPVIKTFDRVEVRVRFIPKTDIQDPGLYVGILTSEYQRLTGLDFKDFTTIGTIRAGTEAELGFVIDSLPLLHGQYQLELFLKDMMDGRIEHVPMTFPFEVVETPIYGGRHLDHWYGFIGLHAQPLASGYEAALVE